MSPRIVEIDRQDAGEAHPAVEAEPEAKGEVARLGQPAGKPVNEGPEPLPPSMSDDESSEEQDWEREKGAVDDGGGGGDDGGGGADGADAGPSEEAGGAAGEDVGGDGENPQELHILSEHAKWRLQTNTEIGAPALAPPPTPLPATSSGRASPTPVPAAATARSVRERARVVEEEDAVAASDHSGGAAEPKINHEVKAVMRVCV